MHHYDAELAGLSNGYAGAMMGQTTLDPEFVECIQAAESAAKSLLIAPEDGIAACVAEGVKRRKAAQRTSLIPITTGYRTATDETAAGAPPDTTTKTSTYVLGIAAVGLLLTGAYYYTKGK